MSPGSQRNTIFILVHVVAGSGRIDAIMAPTKRYTNRIYINDSKIPLYVYNTYEIVATMIPIIQSILIFCDNYFVNRIWFDDAFELIGEWFVIFVQFT